MGDEVRESMGAAIVMDVGTILIPGEDHGGSCAPALTVGIGQDPIRMTTYSPLMSNSARPELMYFHTR